MVWKSCSRFHSESLFSNFRCKYFEFNNDNESQSWYEQKCKNINLQLNVIRCLISPTNQHQIIQNCQKSINNCGLLHRLCAALMIPGLPAEVLTEVNFIELKYFKKNITEKITFSRL